MSDGAHNAMSDAPKLAVWEIVLRLVALALVFALGTAWLGWWCVAAIAFVYGVADRGVGRRGAIAGAGVVVGWGAMLLWDVRGVRMTGAARAAAVVGVPLEALAFVTLAFGVVLAVCGAVIGAGVRRKPG